MCIHKLGYIYCLQCNEIVATDPALVRRVRCEDERETPNSCQDVDHRQSEAAFVYQCDDCWDPEESPDGRKAFIYEQWKHALKQMRPEWRFGGWPVIVDHPENEGWQGNATEDQLDFALLRIHMPNEFRRRGVVREYSPNSPCGVQHQLATWMPRPGWRRIPVEAQPGAFINPPRRPLGNDAQASNHTWQDSETLAAAETLADMSAEHRRQTSPQVVDDGLTPPRAVDDATLEAAATLVNMATGHEQTNFRAGPQPPPRVAERPVQHEVQHPALTFHYRPRPTLAHTPPQTFPYRPAPTLAHTPPQNGQRQWTFMGRRVPPIDDGGRTPPSRFNTPDPPNTPVNWGVLGNRWPPPSLEERERSTTFGYPRASSESGRQPQQAPASPIFVPDSPPPGPRAPVPESGGWHRDPFSDRQPTPDWLRNLRANRRRDRSWERNRPRQPEQ